MNNPKKNPDNEPDYPKEVILSDINVTIERGIGYEPEAKRIPSTLVSQAALKHLRSGGGRTRSLLCYEVGQALGVGHADAVTLGAAVELLHNASLIHDDIHDKAMTRRGKPNVRAVYGDDIAILTGDLMISGGYGLLAEMSSIEILRQVTGHVHRTVRGVIDGQCSDLESFKRDPSVDDYISIVAAKSGGLIRLAMELPFIATWQDHSVIDRAGGAAESFAVSYQILDDLLDIDEDSESDKRAQSLNIYHLLAGEIGQESAKRQSSQIALDLLTKVRHDCEQLPCGSGYPLMLRCFELESMLVHELSQ
jgi:geranylgeranyl pyrophosphate synthase